MTTPRSTQGATKHADQWVLAGWLVDGTGNPIRHNVLMGISRGRIAGIKMFHEKRPLPADCVDLSHATLIPPLIDAHVHLALSGIRDSRVRERQLSPTFESARQTIAGHLAAYARHGILAVRDGGDRHGHVLRCTGALARTELSHVRVAAPCWAWHARGRYGRMIGHSPREGAGLVEAVAAASRGADHIKLIQSGLNSLDHYGRCGGSQFDIQELRAVTAFARRNRMPVMVHANGEHAVAQAIEAGCDSVEHGYFMGDENLRRLADAQIAWLPTLVPMAALAGVPSLSPGQRDTARRTLDHQLEQVRRGRQFGAPIVLGTDAGSVGVNHAVAVMEEMAWLLQAGLPVAEVVSAATGRAARLMGLETGHQLAPGMAASFIAVPGDPDTLPGNLKTIAVLCVEGVWS